MGECTCVSVGILNFILFATTSDTQKLMSSPLLLPHWNRKNNNNYIFFLLVAYWKYVLARKFILFLLNFRRKCPSLFFKFYSRTNFEYNRNESAKNTICYFFQVILGRKDFVLYQKRNYIVVRNRIFFLAPRKCHSLFLTIDG